MRKILKEIQPGQFAREWGVENPANRPVFNSLRETESRGLMRKWARSSVP